MVVPFNSSFRLDPVQVLAKVVANSTGDQVLFRASSYMVCDSCAIQLMVQTTPAVELSTDCPDEACANS